MDRLGLMKSLGLLLMVILTVGCNGNPFEVEGNESGDLKILSLTANPDTIYVGQISLIKSKTNREGEIQYQWGASLGYFIGSGNEVRYSASSCCLGTNTITCLVSDQSGQAATASIKVTVK